MDSKQESAPGGEFWDNVRQTVSGGLREMRAKGEELARQGRLRMDIFQEERRQRENYIALGEVTFDLMKQALPVNESHPRVKELSDRIRFHQGEIDRLRAELARQSDGQPSS